MTSESFIRQLDIISRLVLQAYNCETIHKNEYLKKYSINNKAPSDPLCNKFKTDEARQHKIDKLLMIYDVSRMGCGSYYIKKRKNKNLVQK